MGINVTAEFPHILLPQYLHEQRLAPRVPAVEELFALEPAL